MLHLKLIKIMIMNNLIKLQFSKFLYFKKSFNFFIYWISRKLLLSLLISDSHSLVLNFKNAFMMIEKTHMIIS